MPRGASFILMSAARATGTPGQSGPQAAAYSTSTSVNTALTIPILDFCTGIDNLVTVAAGTVTGGSATVDASRQIVFTPTTGWTGNASIPYTLRKTGYPDSTATITCAVQAVVGGSFGFNRELLIGRQLDMLTGPLTDHVAHLKLSGAWLKSRANGGRIADGAFDLQLKDADGTVLPHHVDRHDAANGDLYLFLKQPAWEPNEESFRVRLDYGDAAITTDRSQPATCWSAAKASWRPDTGVDARGALALTPTSVTAGTLGGFRAGVLAASSGLRAANASTLLNGADAFTLDFRIQPSSIASAGTIFRVGSASSAAEADTKVHVRFLTSVTVANPRPTVSSVTLTNCLKVSVRWGSTTHHLYTASNTFDTTDQHFQIAFRKGGYTKLFRNGIGMDLGAVTKYGTTALAVATTDELTIGNTSLSGEDGLPGTYGRFTLWSTGKWRLAQAQLAYRSRRNSDTLLSLSAENAAADTTRAAVAPPMQVSVKKGGTIDVDVAAAGYDPAGGTITLTAATAGTKGTATIVSNKLRYARSSVGADAITVTVRNSQTGKTSTARIAFEPPITAQARALDWGGDVEPGSGKSVNLGVMAVSDTSLNSFFDFFDFRPAVGGTPVFFDSDWKNTDWAKTIGPLAEDDFTSNTDNTQANLARGPINNWLRRNSGFTRRHFAWAGVNPLPAFSLFSEFEKSRQGDNYEYYRKLGARWRWQIEQLGADYRKFFIRFAYEMNQDTALQVDSTATRNGSRSYGVFDHPQMTTAKWREFCVAVITALWDGFGYEFGCAVSPAYESTRVRSGLGQIPYDDFWTWVFTLCCCSYHPTDYRCDTLAKARARATDTSGSRYTPRLAAQVARDRGGLLAFLEHNVPKEAFGTYIDGDLSFIDEAYDAFGLEITDNLDIAAYSGLLGVHMLSRTFPAFAGDADHPAVLATTQRNTWWSALMDKVLLHFGKAR